MTTFDNSITDSDVQFLRVAIGLAKNARDLGEQPIGALLVDRNAQVLKKAHNEIVSTGNSLAHPELILSQWACDQLSLAERQSTVLYTSQESCAMCASAAYWSGFRQVVFAFSGDQLRDIRGAAFPTISMRSKPLAAFFSGLTTQMRGPSALLEEEATEVHTGYWGSAT